MSRAARQMRGHAATTAVRRAAVPARGRGGAWPAALRGGLPLAAAIVAIVACSLPVLRAGVLPPDNDAAQYLSLALDAYHGRGFTFDGTLSEPLLAGWRWYPLLFVPFFKLLGVGVAAAGWANKAALLACGLTTLALGWRLYGSAAGLAAAVLVVTSPLLTRSTLSLEVDISQAAALLAFLALFHTAATRRDWRWFLLAGLALGLAQRLRESALIWLPLPLLLVLLLPEWRERRTLRGSTLCYAAFVAVLAPKLIHDGFLDAPSWMDALGAAQQRLLLAGLLGLPLLALAAAYLHRFLPARIAATRLGLPFAAAAVLACMALATGGLLLTAGGESLDPLLLVSRLAGYWDDRLDSVLSLWPLLLLGWAAVTVSALRGSHPDRVLVLAGLLYLPILAPLVMLNWNPRYLAPLVALSWLAWAAALSHLAGWLVPRLRARAPRLPTEAAPLGVALVGLALTASVLATTRLPDGDDGQAATNKVVGQTGEWLLANAPPDSPVLAHYSVSSWLHFSTDGRYPIWTLPTERPLTAATIAAMEQQGRPFVHIVTLQTNSAVPTFSVLCRDTLDDRLLASRARFVVLIGGGDTGGPEIGPVFATPAFRAVYSTADTRRDDVRASIYATDGSAASRPDAPLVISGEAARLLGAQGVDVAGLAPHGARLIEKDDAVKFLTPGGSPGDKDSIAGWLARNLKGKHA